MFSSLMRSHDASPGMPARWMTASAPWQAAVIASMSVTDAAMASSPGPGRGRGDVKDAQRAARPGQPRPQHGPDEARGPGDDDDGHSSALSHPGQATVGYQVVYALFLSAWPFRRLGILMGLTRGSLALPRMNAHRLVIIAAAFTIVVAAALATALVTFSSQALPRAVRHDLSRATGTSFVIRGNVTAAQGAQYTSLLPGKISAALEGEPFPFYHAYAPNPLGFGAGSRPPAPGNTRTDQIIEAATLQAVPAQTALVSGHWPA